MLSLNPIALTYSLIRTAGAPVKQRISRFSRVVMLQARYPSIKCHYTADIQVHGELIARGRVSIGRHSRIYVKKGGRLVFGGRNIVLDYVSIAVGAGDCINIDSDVSIQDGCMLLGNIKIGQFCLLAPRVFMSSGTHQFKGDLRDVISPWTLIKVQDAVNPFEGKQVSIGRDCWLGINTVIMPGSLVPDGCIVGANSVVTKHLSVDYGIYSGCPARLIGHRWISPVHQLLGNRGD